MKTLIKLTLIFALSQSDLLAKIPQDNPRINYYFEELSSEKIDFEPVGMVCERVAVREVESVYPSVNYKIINGISYDDKKTTIGELDVVIFNKNTDKVEAIAEVKCWKSYKNALKKVKDQRIRFITNLNRNIKIYDKNGKIYSKAQFNQVQKYFSISQSGGQNQGFDFELSLDFK